MTEAAWSTPPLFGRGQAGIHGPFQKRLELFLCFGVLQVDAAQEYVWIDKGTVRGGFGTGFSGNGIELFHGVFRLLQFRIGFRGGLIHGFNGHAFQQVGAGAVAGGFVRQGFDRSNAFQTDQDDLSVFQHLHGADLFGSGLGARFFNGFDIPRVRPKRIG